MTQVFSVKKTAAVAIVDADLFKDEGWITDMKHRILSQIAVVGSTNPNDFAVKIFAGNRELGTFYNSQGGANVVPNKDDLIPVGAFIPGGQRLRCIVIDAAAANDVIIQPHIKPATSRKTYTRKTYYPRRSYYRRR